MIFLDALPTILSQMTKRYSLVPTQLPTSAEWVKDDRDMNDMFSYFDKEMMRQWAGPEKYNAKRLKRKIAILFNLILDANEVKVVGILSNRFLISRIRKKETKSKHFIYGPVYRVNFFKTKKFSFSWYDNIKE